MFVRQGTHVRVLAKANAVKLGVAKKALKLLSCGVGMVLVRSTAGCSFQKYLTDCHLGSETRFLRCAAGFLMCLDVSKMVYFVLQ